VHFILAQFLNALNVKNGGGKIRYQMGNTCQISAYGGLTPSEGKKVTKSAKKLKNSVAPIAL
jgi:hypothetical protein